MKYQVNKIRRIFRMLQLFCEGHYLDMQDFLRRQIYNGQPNPKSINIISQSTFKFGQLLKFLNSDCITFGQQLMEFLIEVIQGPCKMNQKAIIQNKIIDYIKDLYRVFQKKIDYERRGFNTES